LPFQDKVQLDLLNIVQYTPRRLRQAPDKLERHSFSGGIPLNCRVSTGKFTAIFLVCFLCIVASCSQAIAQETGSNPPVERQTSSLTMTDILSASELIAPESQTKSQEPKPRKKVIEALKATARPVAGEPKVQATQSEVPVKVPGNSPEQPTEKVFDPAPIASVTRSSSEATAVDRVRISAYSAVNYSTGNEEIDRLVLSSASRYGIDPHLIFAVMRQESSFNPRAVSYKGARGLMQLMPATAARLGVREIHDPAQNIDGGARYLRFLLDTFDGNVELALAGYNAGEGAVARYGYRVPPYRETINYVQRISAHYQRLKGGYAVPVKTGRPMSAEELKYEPELFTGMRSLTVY
jgi:hypothetical protein